MTPKPEYEDVVRWCERKMQELRDRLSPLEVGSARLGRKLPDGDWLDITGGEMVWMRQQIRELKELIVDYSGPGASRS